MISFVCFKMSVTFKGCSKMGGMVGKPAVSFCWVNVTDLALVFLHCG